MDAEWCLYAASLRRRPTPTSPSNAEPNSQAAAVPPPPLSFQSCDVDVACIPAMPPFMMVFSGLGLLLLARRYLQS